MSRGPGKLQRAVLTVLEDSVASGYVMPLSAQEIAGRIWDSPSRSQTGTVRRALCGLSDRGLAGSRRVSRSLLWER
jgi:hypothetical protein